MQNFSRCLQWTIKLINNILQTILESFFCICLESKYRIRTKIRSIFKWISSTKFHYFFICLIKWIYDLLPLHLVVFQTASWFHTPRTCCLYGWWTIICCFYELLEQWFSTWSRWITGGSNSISSGAQRIRSHKKMKPFHKKYLNYSSLEELKNIIFYLITDISIIFENLEIT